MKKIRITLIIAGKEDYPGCRDIIAACNEFEVVAQHSSLASFDLWDDLERSDVILLDEQAVSQDGKEAIRRIHEGLPYSRIMLIMDKPSKNKTMEALSMGVSGVMERAGILATIRKAIPVLYSGETWVSRGLVKSLHSQLQYTGDDSFFFPLTEEPVNLKN